MEKLTVCVATSANMDIDKILIREDRPISITMNFANHLPPIGIAKLYKKDGNIMADMALVPNIDAGCLLGYPCLCGHFTKSQTSNYCTAGVIFGMAICGTPNVDPNIQPVYIQCNIKLEAILELKKDSLPKIIEP